ncbi:hypothetical protein OZD68_04110 [Wolbachia endosymbiont of Drosophila bicornuta]|uniref:hypothetical protein n=1 Tax=Wolbachia endosymbiont of Drosophila bicornuta TaxID=375918 RepID=UPI0023A9FBE5|nr:hypothetical protein [Wolbachia endosymbiont of Drosophila bicornuta]MDE5056758.1 hypothetical protein [Wolbachia endosymbiont of Drosophila bicornuta]
MLEKNPRWKNKNTLSLIIRLCLRTITADEKEVLTKLLKHKDLDFSYEQYAQLKQTIEQAIQSRLTDTINRKDLDDVKKLVEDNCFINRAVVTAALWGVDNPVNSIKDYLNEKFPANTNNIPEDFEKFLQGLERTKAQLVEKEQELTNKTSKISLLERDLGQVRQKKSAQKTKINDLNSEV